MILYKVLTIKQIFFLKKKTGYKIYFQPRPTDQYSIEG